MTETLTANEVVGAKLIDGQGTKVGTIGQLYLDDQTRQPEWVTVNTGLFGTKESFVPVSEAHYDGESLQVPYAKDEIKDAPNVGPERAHLTEEEESELYRHYGLQYEPYDRASSGVASDDAMTRSEERLKVDKERQVTGTARLRKWVETEQVQVTVPVAREKARLVTEPITDANRGQAISGQPISEAEHEVTLTEERPVVGKETVPVERVRLEKESQTDDETVSEDIAKERIDTEGDVIDVNRPAGTPRN